MLLKALEYFKHPMAIGFINHLLDWFMVRDQLMVIV